MKRVTKKEAEGLRELDIYSDKVCQLATHFTLTPLSKQYPAALYSSPWQEVTYYTDIIDSTVHPLMQLMSEWNMPSDKENENLTG